ncbi:hypothetical protein SI65_04182 [Aspergillus cristatus]|uniref:Uncharacterized protein n=1 Tax=Aspergillus cristatus TaxID=573508 RepID=A0A1E3BJL1_ASPCR|nr:hypothetical protein SI65_04182 [Aspergillus cristatus]
MVDGRPKYSIEKINDLPTVIGCVELVWLFVSSSLADFLKERAPVIAGLGLIQLSAYIVFYVWSSNTTFIMAQYIALDKFVAKLKLWWRPTTACFKYFTYDFHRILVFNQLLQGACI